MSSIELIKCPQSLSYNLLIHCQWPSTYRHTIRAMLYKRIWQASNLITSFDFYLYLFFTFIITLYYIFSLFSLLIVWRWWDIAGACQSFVMNNGHLYRPFYHVLHFMFIFYVYICFNINKIMSLYRSINILQYSKKTHSCFCSTSYN